MNCRIIKNDSTGNKDRSLELTSRKIVLQAMIPSLERRIEEIKEYAADSFFIDSSVYGYRNITGNHLLEKDLGAFIIGQEVEGFNYFDNGNVYKCLDVIMGIKREGTQIHLLPLVNELNRAGYTDHSGHKRYELVSLKDGILSYNHIIRTDFERKLVHNNCGVIYADSKYLDVAKGEKSEERTLDLNRLMSK